MFEGKSANIRPEASLLEAAGLKGVDSWAAAMGKTEAFLTLTSLSSPKNKKIK